jgi:putative zinc finger/helix-turn-helix YgiT family protein
VLLKGIRVFTCAACGEETPEIPNLLQLHRVIAKAVLTKDTLLTGAEIRFLRRYMGLKAKAFAELMGTTDVTVSRWETQANPIDPQTDRLIRLLVVRQLEEERKKVLFRGFAAHLAKVSTSVSRPVSVQIPKRQLEGRADAVFAAA